MILLAMRDIGKRASEQNGITGIERRLGCKLLCLHGLASLTEPRLTEAARKRSTSKAGAA
jgi:hypothetical protein